MVIPKGTGAERKKIRPQKEGERENERESERERETERERERERESREFRGSEHEWEV